jgi:hypothetical protein
LPPAQDDRLFFFFFRFAAAGSPLGHAGASLAGNDSAPASATGSSDGDFLLSGFAILLLRLRFAGMRGVSVLVDSPLAARMGATAIDVRRIFHRFALRAAIAVSARDT